MGVSEVPRGGGGGGGGGGEVAAERRRENENDDGKREERKEMEFAQEEERKVEMSRLRAANPIPPIQIQTTSPGQAQTIHIPPQSTPTPQQQQTAIYWASLNSGTYTNRISLLLFLLHLVAAVAAVGFLIYRAVEGLLRNGTARMRREEKRLLKFWLPQIEGSAAVGIALSWAWQWAFRRWPAFMVRSILWGSFATSLTAGVLLLCFSMASTDGVGIALIAFAIGNSLYTCWAYPRIEFAAQVISKSLQPAARFPDLNQPTWLLLAVAAFIWVPLWGLALIGALNFQYPPLVIMAMLLSLAWTAEVMRNVVNLTVCRAISLYYLRGMQSTTQFCFLRAMSTNLGSACLGSLFVPTIEALRIFARVLYLLKGEDEFMFSCAHCCLKIMEAIFRCGNGWAYVHIAAYGKDFVSASRSTWALFQEKGMEALVDSDMTSAICFLTGTASGSLCVIVCAPWTLSLHREFTATVSMLSFFIGYLMARITMALPHACVNSYYVCYAENPTFRLFDDTIKDRLHWISRGMVVPTPRIPRHVSL